MDKTLQAQIDKLQEEANELSEIREDVLTMKADINVAALGNLLEKLNSGIDELVEDNAKKEYYDKNLCGTLKDTVTQLVAAFSKIKAPSVEFSPKISVDLNPLQSIAGDISKQNGVIINLLSRPSGDNGELQRAVLAMIGKQNDLISKGLQQIDYSKQLSELIAAIKPNGKEIVEYKINRNPHGFLSSVEPIYKIPK